MPTRDRGRLRLPIAVVRLMLRTLCVCSLSFARETATPTAMPCGDEPERHEATHDGRLAEVGFDSDPVAIAIGLPTLPPCGTSGVVTATCVRNYQRERVNGILISDMTMWDWYIHDLQQPQHSQ